MPVESDGKLFELPDVPDVDGSLDALLDDELLADGKLLEELLEDELTDGILLAELLLDDELLGDGELLEGRLEGEELLDELDELDDELDDEAVLCELEED